LKRLELSWNASVVQWLALLIFLIFCITLWVPWCAVGYDFRIKTMFGSSLPPVVYRRVHVLFTLFVFACLTTNIYWELTSHSLSGWFMVFNATFNNILAIYISVLSWRPVLWVDYLFNHYLSPLILCTQYNFNVIKLRQVSGFLRVIWIPHHIKTGG
jgi:hypothetical protein